VIKKVIHRARRLWAAGLADDLGRNAGNRGVVRHRLEDDRSGGDARAVADFDIAESFGAGPDQHAVADLWMAITRLLAGAAERGLSPYGDVVLDPGGPVHHQAGRVVEEDSTPDAHGRIDIGLEHRRRAALQIISKILATPAPQPMSKAVRLNRVEALEVKHRFEKAVGRGVAVDRRDDIGAEGRADRRLGPERVALSLPAQPGRILR